MNSIGPFQFAHLSQMAPGHKMTTTVQSRAGVDGIFYWLNGRRGQQFSVTSVYDAINLADAVLAIQNYEATIGAIANYVFGGVQLPRQVGILDVVPIPDKIRQTVIGVGGVLGTSNGLAMASWQLITTDVPAA